MCIAILQPKGTKKISKESLEVCATSNSDGFGLAYFDDTGKQVVKKYVPSDKFSTKKTINTIYDMYLEAREQSKSDLMLHFRYSTGGKRDERNCHPFVVNEDMVMCHNGVISNLSLFANVSDTWCLNEYIIKPHFATLADFEEKKDKFPGLFLEKLVGSGKLVFLTKDGYKFINETAGKWDDGIWYSNTGYQVYKSTSYYPAYDYSKYSPYSPSPVKSASSKGSFTTDDTYWKPKVTDQELRRDNRKKEKRLRRLALIKKIRNSVNNQVDMACNGIDPSCSSLTVVPQSTCEICIDGTARVLYEDINMCINCYQNTVKHNPRVLTSDPPINLQTGEPLLDEETDSWVKNSLKDDTGEGAY